MPQRFDGCGCTLGSLIQEQHPWVQDRLGPRPDEGVDRANDEIREGIRRVLEPNVDDGAGRQEPRRLRLPLGHQAREYQRKCGVALPANPEVLLGQQFAKVGQRSGGLPKADTVGRSPFRFTDT
jgi:hypothetical protein